MMLYMRSRLQQRGVGVSRVSCLIGREETKILRFPLDFAKFVFQVSYKSAILDLGNVVLVVRNTKGNFCRGGP